jgi:hypothetical protein
VVAALEELCHLRARWAAVLVVIMVAVAVARQKALPVQPQHPAVQAHPVLLSSKNSIN